MKLKENIASMKPYVPGKTIPGAVKLSSNENPLGPSPKGIEAIRNTLNQIHRYPDGLSTDLRQVLSRHWNLSPDNILIANGSDEIFTLLSAAWLPSGTNAVSCRETFSQYRYAVRLFNGKMKEANLRSGKFDLDAITALVDEETRIVFICNPNNPTGTYLKYEELSHFLLKISENIIVVIDEAYADFADADDFPDTQSLLKRHQNLVVVRTFSKLYGLAGLRIGYAVGDSQLIRSTERASMPFNVNLLAQVAAEAALDDTEHREATLNLVKQERTFLAGEFHRRGIFAYPSQANFVCFSVNREVSELWTPIAKRGIAVRNLKSFAMPNMIRYTYGEHDKNVLFLSILDELCEFS